jgi:hypothetical protein
VTREKDQAKFMDVAKEEEARHVITLKMVDEEGSTNVA